MNLCKMKTTHKIIYEDAREMKDIKSNSVDLMVTSPPYPMIEMWDKMFAEQNQEISKAIKEHNGDLAFELMHKELDKVWKETYRVLRDGGIACINIGDATRKVNSSFKLYPNHARIITYCTSLGFHVLPEILWRKQSNKPNKFMGSGMLPVGAYMTLEHEYILILRKGIKREFKTETEKLHRQISAFFWEERNIWFSDVWDIKGDKQVLNHDKVRERSASYPVELTSRLINMFSVQGDTILDPYLGTGTTTLGAIITGRNSIGIEIDKHFREIIERRIKEIKEIAIDYTDSRIKKHLEFIDKRTKEKGEVGYFNKNHNFPIMTRQEINLKLPKLKEIKELNENLFEAEY